MWGPPQMLANDACQLSTGTEDDDDDDDDDDDVEGAAAGVCVGRAENEKNELVVLSSSERRG